MDIRDLVSTEFDTFDGEARASELYGAFSETGAKAVVVTEDDGYLGLVTQRQLREARRDPAAKARGLVWHVGRLDIDDDVRTAARLMLGSTTEVLPVFDGSDLIGLLTADALLEKVQPFCSVLTVGDVCTHELVSVKPGTSLGSVLHTLRERKITHLPVVEGAETVGIVSLADVISITTREIQRDQGGSPGGQLEMGGGRTHGGFGERSGRLDRILDLPAADVMTAPVMTTAPDAGLDEAVDEMLDAGISSLVVTDEEDRPAGIVTKTDVLRALTVPDTTLPPVQITNIELLDDIDREAVGRMIAGITRKHGGLTLLEANVHLHKHEERLRGTPLIQSRIRLFTDKGHFVGTGEGYGASHALNIARNVVERKILDDKQYARTKKHPTEEERAKLHGWELSG